MRFRRRKTRHTHSGKPVAVVRMDMKFGGPITQVSCTCDTEGCGYPFAVEIAGWFQFVEVQDTTFTEGG